MIVLEKSNLETGLKGKFGKDRQARSSRKGACMHEILKFQENPSKAILNLEVGLPSVLNED